MLIAKHGFFLGLNLFLLCYELTVRAEITSCPKPEDVKQENISREFDWTVSEDVSLHSILNVNHLFAVSIENNGEFFTCTYDSESLQIRLDAKPITVGCRLKPGSDEWFSHTLGQEICLEEDKLNCRINVEC